MKSLTHFFLLILFIPFIAGAGDSTDVPLYGVFEKSVTNQKGHKNPFDFKEVELQTTFTSPSGRVVHFRGFYDGEANWKFRFMPDKPGRWKYHYRFSDHSAKEGRGSFNAVKQGALKGVIRAYKKNPRWFAYHGNEPVFLKSYNLSNGAFFGTPIEWAVSHVYGKILERGYNHLQLFILPLNPKPACNILDAPQGVTDTVFRGLEPTKTMNL